MINIVYHRSYHRVTIEGHANSGEAGHDLACAAVTALAYTLGVAVVNFAKHGAATKPQTEFSKGRAVISCTPKRRHENTVTLVMDNICGGLEYLAMHDMEHIRFESRG